MPFQLRLFGIISSRDTRSVIQHDGQALNSRLVWDHGSEAGFSLVIIELIKLE